MIYAKKFCNRRIMLNFDVSVKVTSNDNITARSGSR